MPRIQPVDPATAEGKAKQLLDGVQKAIGMTPNLMRTLANGPAALEGYLQLNQALSHGRLNAKLRESIALAIAGFNGCHYCASAHTAIAGMVGLDKDEASQNLSGRGNDPKTASAVTFALQVARNKGRVNDADLAAVRAAGFTDGDIAEIVGHVAVNTFTNYFNNLAQTDVDFPKVEIPALA